MAYLEHFLLIRATVLWQSREQPSYLGPSAMQLVLFFILFVTNSMTLFAISLLLARNTWSLGANVTTIEGWEIERHRTLVRRARKRGGYLDGPDGTKVKVIKQEFPYDIGILRNIGQGMGCSPLFWLWPLARTPSNMSGLAFQRNGFEGIVTRSTASAVSRSLFPDAPWPPPDPDRMPRHRLSYHDQTAFTRHQEHLTTQEQIAAFRRRQQEDLKRFDGGSSSAIKGGSVRKEFVADNTVGGLGGHAWRDCEGEGLDDFGVDEHMDFYDEDNIPLAELKGRKWKAEGLLEVT
ncbi:MAG: hypothetical protein Q9163_001984 [Psora crenata]